jgi:hypothetical protein
MNAAVNNNCVLPSVRWIRAGPATTYPSPCSLDKAIIDHYLSLVVVSFPATIHTP